MHSAPCKVHTLKDAQFLYLTTTGRRTGLPREIEIWFTTRGDLYYIIAEKREEANWVQNLLANPRVSFRVGQARFEGRARVVREDTEAALAHDIQQRSVEKYGWGGGLVVELTPGESSENW